MKLSDEEEEQLQRAKSAAPSFVFGVVVMLLFIVLTTAMILSGSFLSAVLTALAGAISVVPKTNAQWTSWPKKLTIVFFLFLTAFLVMEPA